MNEQKQIDDAQKLVELTEILGIDIGGLSYDDLDDLYDDMLRDITETTEILGVTVDAAKFLKDNDPTAYRCSKNDWLDSQLKDQLLFDIGEQYLTVEELKELKENLQSEIDDLL